MQLLVQEGRPFIAASRALGAMFEDRKSVFVDLLGWNVPVLDGRFEMDGFDDEQAIYLIIVDAEGDHLGSARLLPTTRPHILDTLFPGLSASAPPRGADIFEITRFCLSRRQSAKQRLAVRNRLVSALAAFAIERGIATYTGVAEFAWLQQILAFGWDCRPLGVPMQYGTQLLGALAIEISEDTPAKLAANGIWFPSNATSAEVRAEAA